MKVVEFLKRFNELVYDDETDLDILFLDNECRPYFLDIYDVCNNADCSGINVIGIVLRNMQEVH